MPVAILRVMRAFMPAVIILAAAGAFWRAEAAGEARSLTFYNIHTKETETITYKRDGEFIPEGMKRINHMMRDWRRDEATEMDPELIDTIWAIYQDLGSTKPIHLISGYRSRKTNNRLRARGGGQASNSRHILGKAADIHLPDVDVKKLRNSALVREVGGVGYYPKSGIPFVHVDTGRVRHWPRLPRQELAMLFPDGKTRHVPSDGRPLTRRDSEIAMAKLDKKIDDFIDRKSKIELPPRMMMAGFTPPSLGLAKAKASADITASIPRETEPAQPPPVKRAAAPAAAPSPKPDAAKPPEPRPGIDIARIEDAEHPEELTYESHSVLPLLGDAPVSADRRLAQMIAPGADDEGYILRDAEEGYSVSLARGLGYTQELKLVTFGADGDLAMAPIPLTANRPLRTASR